MFLQILLLDTNTRGSFVEDMFNDSPSVIFRDERLEGFLGKGCDWTKYCVDNGLGKFLGHYDVSLTGFVMGDFFHIREQKVKKGF